VRGELNDFEKKILQADLHNKKIPTQHQCRAVGIKLKNPNVVFESNGVEQAKC